MINSNLWAFESNRQAIRNGARLPYATLTATLGVGPSACRYVAAIWYRPAVHFRSLARAIRLSRVFWINEPLRASLIFLSRESRREREGGDPFLSSFSRLRDHPTVVWVICEIRRSLITRSRSRCKRNAALVFSPLPIQKARQAAPKSAPKSRTRATCRSCITMRPRHCREEPAFRQANRATPNTTDREPPRSDSPRWFYARRACVLASFCSSMRFSAPPPDAGSLLSLSLPSPFSLFVLLFASVEMRCRSALSSLGPLVD
jgi:hypothetical protein